MNLDDLWEGDMTAVTVDGETVLLVNVDGTVRAYSNRCPHQAYGLAVDRDRGHVAFPQVIEVDRVPPACGLHGQPACAAPLAPPVSSSPARNCSLALLA